MVDGIYSAFKGLIHSCRRAPEFRPELGVYKPEFWFGVCVCVCVCVCVARETQSHRVCNDCVQFTSVKCQTLGVKT
jgi:hypothetical protein